MCYYNTQISNCVPQGPTTPTGVKKPKLAPEGSHPNRILSTTASNLCRLYYAIIMLPSNHL